MVVLQDMAQAARPGGPVDVVIRWERRDDRVRLVVEPTGDPGNGRADPRGQERGSAAWMDIPAPPRL